MSHVNCLLLCTDLDRTLLPNGAERESEQARKIFADFASLSQITLVYVTGRHQQLVEQAVNEYQLPQADFVISDVGSKIYKVTDSQWHYMDDWEKNIDRDWQGKSTNDLHNLLTNVQGLKLQEQSKQNTHKLSYYVGLDQDHLQILSKVKQVLKQYDITFNLVWSVDEPANIGLLDVLPASAGKRQAIEFLVQQLGFDYTNTVFAGDSGNDLCVMSSLIQSVLVANADKDVIDEAIRQAKIYHQENTLYIARGGFMNMNGNYSAGILEGVVHYIPLAEQWLAEKHGTDKNYE